MLRQAAQFLSDRKQVILSLYAIMTVLLCFSYRQTDSAYAEELIPMGELESPNHYRLIFVRLEPGIGRPFELSAVGGSFSCLSNRLYLGANIASGYPLGIGEINYQDPAGVEKYTNMGAIAIAPVDIRFLISSGRSRSSYLQKKGQIDIDEDGNAVCLHHPFYLYFIGSLCVLRNLTPESELTEAGKLGKLIDLGLGWSFVGKSPGIGLKAGYFFAHFPSDSSSLGHRYEEWNKGSFYISLDIELPNSWGIVGKPLSPPRLSASASFSDPQGNDDDVLNPEEKGTLSVDLRNRGQGLARDVRIVPQVENKELEDKIKFRGKLKVKEIKPGETKTVSMSIIADRDLPPGDLKIMLSGKDRLGNPVSTTPLNVVMRQSRPPYLATTVEFDDSASQWANGLMDGGEQTKLIVTVSNSGEGNGYVTLNFSVSGVSVPVPVPIEIGAVRPGEEERVEVPIEVPIKSKSGTTKITVVAKERAGNDAPTVIKALRVKAIDMPVLKVANVRVEDGRSGFASGNGNGLAENDETIQLSVSVENEGVGDAVGVNLKLTTITPGVQIVKEADEIGFLKSKRRTDGNLAFSIPKTFQAENIQVGLEVIDSRGIGESRSNHNIPYHLRVPLITLSKDVIQDGQTQRSRGNSDGIIHQGEIIDLKLILGNSGELDAQDLRLHFSTSKESVELLQKEATVGTLPAGRSGESVTVPFNVQSAAVPGEFSIEVVVAQADFPSLSKTFPLTIIEREEDIIPPEPDKPVVSQVNAIPVIVIAGLGDNQVIVGEKVILSGTVTDDKGVSKVEIRLNNQEFEGRGFKVASKPGDPKNQSFQAEIPLREGENIIQVVAYDTDNARSQATRTVIRSKEKPEFWAVVIGISDYLHVPDLKYTDEDAGAFYNHLVDTFEIPEDHIWTLYDNEANLRQMRRVLGTELSRKAKENDTVIIYYAGHGGSEQDMQNPDGDGLEKYILPCDADPDDLYSTALPMAEISRIFGRIVSDRVVFIADACYSGASGGRTILSSGRNIASDGFLERITRGKGRVIMTASSANELSTERDDLQHGVFTYHLLAGLRGAADYNKDGDITVDEVYIYVSREVPKATGQKQNPKRKGDVEGQIILGKVK